MKPLIYSCSGCSSAAQMANYIAIKIDRKEIAEMSCIGGVGGNVKKLSRQRSQVERLSLLTAARWLAQKHASVIIH